MDQQFDANALKINGKPFPIAEDVIPVQEGAIRTMATMLEIDD